MSTFNLKVKSLSSVFLTGVAMEATPIMLPSSSYRAILDRYVVFSNFSSIPLYEDEAIFLMSASFSENAN